MFLNVLIRRKKRKKKLEFKSLSSMNVEKALLFKLAVPLYYLAFLVLFFPALTFSFAAFIGLLTSFFPI